MSEILSNNQIVSDESESLILVSELDQDIGFLDKAACHDGDGKLHRAFSLFLFNRKGEVLIQQRVANKRLWPQFWSNSCCSHPRQSESMEIAVERRVQEELGLRANMQFLYKFQYHANYLDKGSEHELCYVYVGLAEDPLNINQLEIKDSKWVSQQELDRLLVDESAHFTPWLKLEWKELRSRFAKEIAAIISL